MLRTFLISLLLLPLLLQAGCSPKTDAKVPSTSQPATDPAAPASRANLAALREAFKRDHPNSRILAIEILHIPSTGTAYRVHYRDPDYTRHEITYNASDLSATP